MSLNLNLGENGVADGIAGCVRDGPVPLPVLKEDEQIEEVKWSPEDDSVKQGASATDVECPETICKQYQPRY